MGKTPQCLYWFSDYDSYNFCHCFRSDGFQGLLSIDRTPNAFGQHNSQLRVISVGFSRSDPGNTPYRWHVYVSITAFNTYCAYCVSFTYSFRYQYLMVRSSDGIGCYDRSSHPTGRRGCLCLEWLCKNTDMDWFPWGDALHHRDVGWSNYLNGLP